MPRDPRAAMLDMVIAIETAVRLMGERSQAEFEADEENHWAVWSQIIILGEAAGRIPSEDQSAMPEIPWSTAIGMRHRLVHGYDSVDWGRVWKTVRDDLPGLKTQLDSRLGE